MNIREGLLKILFPMPMVMVHAIRTFHKFSSLASEKKNKKGKIRSQNHMKYKIYGQ